MNMNYKRTFFVSLNSTSNSRRESRGYNGSKSHYNIEEYMAELRGQIRDRYARDFIADEVRGHIEDQAEAYEENGMSHEEALAKAVNGMGDPVSVGVELDRIHRPHLEWRFLLYVLFIAVLNLCVQYVINRDMPIETGAGVFENLSRVSVITTLIGFGSMLIVYRLDYTLLAGRSRSIGLTLMVSLMLLSHFCSQNIINGQTGLIQVGMLSVSVFALMVLFLPIFAGILYDLRGKGRSAVVQIVLWMFVPTFIMLIAEHISLPSVLFILIAETILFVIALQKNWYDVNKRAVIFGGVGIVAMLIIAGLIRIFYSDGYQRARLTNWLAHFGIGGFSVNAGSEINYFNRALSEAFANSNMFGKSDAAIAIMREIPSYRSNFLLGSVSASCGIFSVIGVIVCLTVLSIYVFNISLRQKNSLGCIVGCACGIAISLQGLSNVLIVFCLLPVTNSVLPFFASGVSFTVVDYILLGLVLSIYRYKDIRQEKPVVNMTLPRVE